MRKLCSTAVLFLLACVSTTHAERRTPEIVQRASRYVDGFIQNFSNVVAEERYVQESMYPHRRRELLSDFLLVTAPGVQGRYQFRDVREVDGATVHDRGDRLTKLFLEPPSDALERAKVIARESERFNLADIGTLDQPLMAVGFLQSRYVSRFAFTLGSTETYDDATVRYVAFRDTARPVIHGYFLIEETTGRVLRSEIDLGEGIPPPRVVTTFRFDDELQMTVPVEMHDPLGVATYGKFRRFGVSSVVTSLAVPEGKLVAAPK